jgi:uncharacterized protein YjiS (DUF1127 family)
MIMSTCETVHPSPVPLVRERSRPGWAALLGRLGVAFAVARERRALRALSDEALKDIGLSRADAYREGTRSFWDLPVDRLR